jgi:hypothetical protein
MAARLGKVLWWIGFISGALIWLAMVASGKQPGSGLFGPNNMVIPATIVAAIPIGIGWVLRYILSGETKI